MFIQTEKTPNPATIKFVPGQPVMGSGSREFRAASEASSSPLAARLFKVDGVKGVFLGADFVSVTKAESVDWDDLKPDVVAALMEHFTSGEPAAFPEDSVFGDAQGEDNEIVSQIKELLDTRVRPAVAQDGGDIEFQGFEKGIVYLRMRGACSGCPSSTATLKMGVERMLRHFIPEVVEVRPVREE